MATRTASAVTKLVLAVASIVALVALLIAFTPLELPSLPNPFSETKKENPNAVVLAELRDQSRYVAASGRFQTVIDQEEDADYLPDVIKGQRLVFIAEG